MLWGLFSMMQRSDQGGKQEVLLNDRLIVIPFIFKDI